MTRIARMRKHQHHVRMAAAAPPPPLPAANLLPHTNPSSTKFRKSPSVCLTHHTAFTTRQDVYTFCGKNLRLSTSYNIKASFARRLFAMKYLIWFLVASLLSVNSYNIDEDKAIVFKMPQSERSSFFGYSVGLRLNGSGNNSW